MIFSNQITITDDTSDFDKGSLQNQEIIIHRKGPLCAVLEILFVSTGFLHFHLPQWILN